MAKLFTLVRDAPYSPYASTLTRPGIAIRTAQILRLHEERDYPRSIESEVRRRTWWTLVMADQWCSAGLGLPRQLRASGHSVNLPCDESDFHNTPVSAGSIRASDRPKTGLWAFMITLGSIFERVQKLNWQLVDHTGHSMDDIDRTVESLAHNLTSWELSLPPLYKWSLENLTEHRRLGTGGAFIALFIGYHHYSTLLYFQFLDQRRNSTQRHFEYARACHVHALCYSDILAISRTHEGCDAVYATVGHMTTVSSSVLLHKLLFGDETSIPKTRDALCSNFEALVKLRHFWPRLSNTVGR